MKRKLEKAKSRSSNQTNQTSSKKQKPIAEVDDDTSSIEVNEEADNEIESSEPLKDSKKTKNVAKTLKPKSIVTKSTPSPTNKKQRQTPTNQSGSKTADVAIPSDKEILEARQQREEEIRNLVPYVNKQRVLVFCSRGVTSLYRHLMEDLRTLLPHSRKEQKHDTKKNLHEINELCDMRDCNNCVFFEARKKDLYLWLTKCPSGPSAKFLVMNVHTMDELRLTGNCLKGSRPLLSFDESFDDEERPDMQLLKELFTQIFGTPKGHPKSKPFIDHVLTFSYLDNRIWFRNFQITDKNSVSKKAANAKAKSDGDDGENVKNEPEAQDPLIKDINELDMDSIQLVEIGPRFVLSLVKIFDGGFSGRTLYENPMFVKPKLMRKMEQLKQENIAEKKSRNPNKPIAKKKNKQISYVERKISESKTEQRKQINQVPKEPFRELYT